MTLAINNRKWLLKNVYIKKKTTTVRKKTVQNGELKFYGGGGQRDILYSIEQIQGNIGTDF